LLLFIALSYWKQASARIARWSYQVDYWEGLARGKRIEAERAAA
jgi:hypothetical protein